LGSAKGRRVKQITATADIKTLGTILGVWAHPDDESFVAGGLLAAAARNGQTVIGVTATKGEAGIQDAAKWPPKQLADIRAAELRDALHILGVPRHFWLDYPDGGCAEAPEHQAVGRLKLLIERFRPDTIITFGPDGLTGHSDHQAVSRWAALAARMCRPRPRIYHVVFTPQHYTQYLVEADAKLNMFFNIDQPPLVDQGDCAIAYRLPDDICELKHRAFAAMPSQMDTLREVLPDQKFHQAFGAEYFVEYNDMPDAHRWNRTVPEQHRVKTLQ
jgi:LmbE family N-acetylglucosaminyl deacetylase